MRGVGTALSPTSYTLLSCRKLIFIYITVISGKMYLKSKLQRYLFMNFYQSYEDLWTRSTQQEAEWANVPHQHDAAPLPDQWCMKLRPGSCNRRIHLMTCLLRPKICHPCLGTVPKKTPQVWSKSSHEQQDSPAIWLLHLQQCHTDAQRPPVGLTRKRHQDLGLILMFQAVNQEVAIPTADILTQANSRTHAHHGH